MGWKNGSGTISVIIIFYPIHHKSVQHIFITCFVNSVDSDQLVSLYSVLKGNILGRLFFYISLPPEFYVNKDI